jgi:glyceraldehyde 3-phosphate dehydrogenase
MPTVAINGLGRIGRAALKILLDADGLGLVAVNDIVDADNLAYLLKYDTVYGRYHREVSAAENALVVDGTTIPALAERDPANLPWQELGVDLVLECTGIFTTAEDLERHVQAGASYVILSAPTKSEAVPTVVHGVNRPDGRPQTISCASCTTNCITPVIEVAHRRFGVERAIMTTVHAYTAGQQLVDGPSKSFRRGRAGAANLVPTSTAPRRRRPERSRTSPGGSTASRSVRRSRWARSRTSSSLPAARRRLKRSTTRFARRPRPLATTASSASQTIRWCRPTSSATHVPPSSTLS